MVVINRRNQNVQDTDKDNLQIQGITTPHIQNDILYSLYVSQLSYFRLPNKQIFIFCMKLIASEFGTLQKMPLKSLSSYIMLTIVLSFTLSSPIPNSFLPSPIFYHFF